MAFIENVKFKEILNAARNGNEKAKAIMQSMRKMQPQTDIDRLVGAYYGVDTEETPIVDEVKTEVEEEVVQPSVEEVVVETINKPENENDVIDLTDILNSETAGLFDEDEYKGVSFTEFLKNKKSDANRALKNADYFKAFDMDGRNRYADGIIDAYKHKFDGNIRDIERGYSDNDKSISMYMQSVGDMLDDEIEFGTDTATKAYNDLIDDENAMSAFGRHWDDDDTRAVVDALAELVHKYGKANVLSALNLIKGDNDAHRNYLNNSIDANIGKYSKTVDKLLR